MVCPPLAHVGCPDLEVTKCCYVQCSRPCPGGVCRAQSDQSQLFTVLAPLPRWGVPLSNLPKYRYLQWSRLCPGGVPLPRNNQSIAIYNVRAPAAHPRSYQFSAIYSVRAPDRVGCAARKITKELLFTVFTPLPRWGVPPSKLLKYCYLQ